MAKTLRDEDLKLNIITSTNQSVRDLEKYEAVTRSLTTENKKLRLEKKLLNKEDENYKTNLKKLNDVIGQNNRKIDESKVKMAELRKNIGLSALTMSQLSKEAKRLRIQLNNTTPNTVAWKKYDNQLKAVNGRMRQLKTGGAATRGMLSRLKGGLTSQIGIYASLTAIIGGLVGAVKGLFNGLSRLQKINHKANIVFGDSLEYVEERAEALANKLYMTRLEFIAATANTADLLIPLDFTRKKASEISTELTKLSGALSEWSDKNLSAAQVSEILTKAMLGENEQLKQLGIAIRKDSDEYTDLVEQKMKMEGATKAQAEALATYELILKKSQDAQTAFRKDGNKLLRWWNELKTSVKQTRDNFIALFDEAESANEIFNKQVSSLANIVTEIDPLLDRYDDLAYKTNLSAEEQAEMKTIIDKVAAAVPYAITEVDNYGNAIAISTGKVKEYIEAEKARLKVINKDAIDEASKNIEGLRNQEEWLRSNINRYIKGHKVNDVFRVPLVRIDIPVLRDATSAEYDEWKEKLKQVKDELTGWQAQVERLNGDFIEKEQKRLTDAEAEIQKQQIEAQKLADAQKNADQRKQSQKQHEQFINNLKKSVASIQQKNREEITDEYDWQLSKAFEAYDDQLKLLKKAKDNQLITQQEYDTAIEEARAARDSRINTMVKSHFDEMDEDEQKRAKESLKKMIEGAEQEYQESQTILTNKYLDEKIKKEEFDQEMQELELAHLQVMLELRRAAGEDTTQLELQLAQKRLQILNKSSKTQIDNTKKETKALEAKAEAAFKSGMAAVEEAESFEEAGKNILNEIRKQIKAYLAKAVAAAVAQEFATKGVLGIITAAAAGALVGVAFNAIVPQFYQGKYPVIGQDDGKQYNAPLVSNPKTGLLTQPTLLAGEQPEFIIDPKTTRNLMINYPEVIDAINYARVPQRFVGQYPEHMQDAGQNKQLIELLQVLNQRLSKPIQANISYETQKEATDKVTEIEAGVGLF